MPLISQTNVRTTIATLILLVSATFNPLLGESATSNSFVSLTNSVVVSSESNGDYKSQDELHRSTNAPAPVKQGSVATQAEIPSLTAKEILSANNQVISQLGQMYQLFGLLITIMIGLVGGIATYMSYVARKSVHEFVNEWKEKLKTIEVDIGQSRERLQTTLAQAEGSAREAATHASNIIDSQRILNQTLQDVDRLRAVVQAFQARFGEQTPPPPAPAPMTPPPAAAATGTGVTNAEQSEVNERLKRILDRGHQRE